MKYKYKYSLKNSTIGLKDIDKETAEEVGKEVPTYALLHEKGESVSAYLLDFIDTDKYPLYRYYQECGAKKAVVYLNDNDVFPVTVNGKQYYISDYSKLKLIAYPDPQYSVYPEPHVYPKNSNVDKANSTDKGSVDPSPKLLNSVLTNVYSELAKMKSDYDKGELPDSCLHFESALEQLKRLKLWG